MLIQDVKDPRTALLDALDEEHEREAWELSKYGNQQLITELYGRGVSIKDIFGRYLEFEVAGDARTMDVEDAQLAIGIGDRSI